MDTKQEINSTIGIITVKANAKETNTSMGLEGYNMVVFPQVKHSEPLAYILGAGNVKRYLTGLDEEHPSIKSIVDKETREAKILSIRKIVQYLEKAHSFNIIDDKELKEDTFWKKVKTFYPTNSDFYSKIKMEFVNDDVFLFPSEKVEDMVKYLALKNGGFSMCSTDKESCNKEGKRWYLSNENAEALVDIKGERLKNKAIAVLESIMDESNRKLFYMSKILIPEASSFRIQTSKEILYNFLNAYLNGKKNVVRIHDAATRFLEVSELSNEELFIKAIVQDLYNYNQIVITSGSHTYVDSESKESYVLGRNVSEVYEHLASPINQEFVKIVQEKVKKNYW